MPLDPGDLLFVGWDSDNNDVAFVATVDIAPGEIIYFTDSEWDGSAFNPGEQLFEWTVPAGGISSGTVVEIDMDPGSSTVTFSSGGDVDYIRGGYQLAGRNEMVWAFQGDRVGNTVTPENFIAVIGNEADGTDSQTPNLSGTGLTTSLGAIIIDGDEDYMEFTTDGSLSSPVERDDLIAAIQDTSNWTTADGAGNNNPNPGGSGFDIVIPAVVCFAAGTRILTTRGQVAIEDLEAGDLVVTRDHGLRPIRWIGRSEVAACAQRGPVLFDAGVLRNTKPLSLSPQHRVLLCGWKAELLFGEREILVPAHAFLGQPGVSQQIRGWVCYYHLLLDDHQVVFAENCPTESLFLGPMSLSSFSDSLLSDLRRSCPDLCHNDTPPMRLAHPTVKFADTGALFDGLPTLSEFIEPPHPETVHT